MCFSVNVNLIKEELESRYGATFLDPEKYNPSYYYHAYSFPLLPSVCNDEPEKIRLLKWGLIPSWIRTPESAGDIRTKTLNARSESIESKPSFSASFKSRRCIIPVKGFFEWQHSGPVKIPWYIYRNDNDIISLAGLWDEWRESPGSEVISTFTIVTTSANSLMAEIHNSKKRMPVILEKEKENLWLDIKSDEKDITELLKPYPSDILKAHTIGPLINNNKANRNTPDLLNSYSWNFGGTLF
jgi:putative SOS response-associated peptidase YedK